MLVLYATAGLIILPAALAAQKDSTRNRRSFDSSYVKSYYHLLDLGVQFGSQYMEYRTYYNDTFYISIRPNEVYTLSPSINYRWLSLSYAFTPEFLDFNNDDSLRGSTRYRRLSASLSLNQLSLSGMWSNTRGFYLANMSQVDSNWKPGDPYTQFPEMEVQRFQFAGLYRTNPNFSLKAIQGGEEEQLRSAWTWLPGLNISHFRFSIPQGPPQAGKIELTNNVDINAILAIAGTWVFARHFFLAGSMGPVFGVDIFNSLAIDENNAVVRANGTRFSSGFSFGLNLGYSNPRWYVGFSNYSSSYRHSVSSTERMAKVLTQFTLYGGFRLQAPPPMKKTLDWAERLLPFLK
ncbi:MAG: DUF4421 domain-containing protein [Chitinophagaceae bacterium]|jgi:hypothetical protein|nr:DUF4421 domain-containing protein [Chitinophagaceae bacterium]